MIGLLCAAREEMSAIEQILDGAEAGRPAGDAVVIEGELSGKPVVVMKTASCGKIGAASAAQFLIDHYELTAIINFGAAGALVDGLDIGDIVVADRLILGDSGIVHGDGFRHTGSVVSSSRIATRHKHYDSDPGLLDAARTAGARRSSASGSKEPRLGTVVTCDQVILSKHTRKYLNESFGALVVEMEAAAVAQVALSNGVPFLAVKAVSDGIEFTAENLEVHLRDCGESRVAHWLRSARYIAVDPGSIKQLGELRDGITNAARSASEMVAGLVEVLG
ncbi:MAG: 5'-methylthioadenosine/S-adenosylhomocysteine nucleosidase [Candidatus Geothermincolia bacterium]